MPFVWAVQLKKSDGTARENATITITNQRTGDTQSGLANAQGQIIFDLANFTDGYSTGDLIDTEKSVSNDDVEYFVSANGDETNPTFVQVINETRTQIYPNSARIKLDLSRHQGGKQVDITLN